MNNDDYPRLLEWTGMVKHWTYDLDGAETCYQKCADLEPINVSIYKCFCYVSSLCCVSLCVCGR